MTLSTSPTPSKDSSNTNSTTTMLDLKKPWNTANLKDDFSYLLELARQTLKSQDMIRNHIMRLAHAMADKFFASEMQDHCQQIEPIIKDFLHRHEIFEFDHLIENVFDTQAWRDVLKELEQSYGRPVVDYNNLLGSRRSQVEPGIATLKASLKWAQQNPSAIPDEMKRDVISYMDKTKMSIQKEAIHTGIAIYPAETELDQTRAAAMEKKEEQLKTPKYRIDEIHKMRQEIVKEGLKAVIDVFTTMHDKTVSEIPIQSDEEAFMIRDGFVALANNYVSMDDDKHRMDFAGWAKVHENIEKYGAEKGLKMSGIEITPHDIGMVDESTLPLNYYPKYDKIGLSYISKEHLDSKGVIIANCFIDMMNQFAWMGAGARLFSYQAKIRGIRAIAVSHKLMGTR